MNNQLSQSDTDRLPGVILDALLREFPDLRSFTIEINYSYRLSNSTGIDVVDRMTGRVARYTGDFKLHKVEAVFQKGDIKTGPDSEPKST